MAAWPWEKRLFYAKALEESEPEREEMPNDLDGGGYGHGQSRSDIPSGVAKHDTVITT